MNKYDKVSAIKELIDVPNTAEKYYELLEKMDDLKALMGCDDLEEVDENE